MKKYKVGKESYYLICDVHHTINGLCDELDSQLFLNEDYKKSYKNKMSKNVKAIKDLIRVALQMGQNMESAIHERNDLIEEYEDTIKDAAESINLIKNDMEKRRRQAKKEEKTRWQKLL